MEAANSEAGSHSEAPLDCQEGPDCEPSEKRTSFYLPSDCVKQLHISSLTTTREVIQGLLKKFMVLDNPRKFALYRQMHRDGQGAETTLTQLGFSFFCFGKHMYETTVNEKFFFLCVFISPADLFQKLPLCERPLLLRLIAGPDPQQLSFVLKENETGEVEVRKHTYCTSTQAHKHTKTCLWDMDRFQVSVAPNLCS